MVGEKRVLMEGEERSELGHKRVKMRDLQSVFRASEVTDTHCSNLLPDKEANVRDSTKKEMSQVTKETITIASNIVEADRRQRDTSQLVIDTAPRTIDLNSKLGVTDNLASVDVPTQVNELPVDGKHDVNLHKSKGIGFDLNAEEVSSCPTHDPFYPYKNYENLKSRDDSECGSSIDPSEEKDSMTKWKEMKQNGFLSVYHGVVPAPKPRGRKSRNDGFKRKMELARKEQVDKFAGIAAPSGLLNGLNPGIINHVRNSKQVHSIIEALVKSEKLETCHAESKQASLAADWKKDPEHLNGSGTNKVGLCHQEWSKISLSASRQAGGASMSLHKALHPNSEHTRGSGDMKLVERIPIGKNTYLSHSKPDTEDDIFALKLPSSPTIAFENMSSLSNEESEESASATSLSVKAAKVASQWLELINQDIRGRLAALQRSKKRVRAVIQTELPFLVSREFSSNQENDPHFTKSSCSGWPNNTTTDMHRARWHKLFDQMDKALSEEERQLENWLNQVKEVQLHCERGLSHYFGTHPLQHVGAFEVDSRHKAHDPERELALQAAAASMYSTCNFLSSMEKLPCV